MPQWRCIIEMVHAQMKFNTLVSWRQALKTFQTKKSQDDCVVVFKDIRKGVLCTKCSKYSICLLFIGWKMQGPGSLYTNTKQNT